jgi:hypothetical protein
MTIGTMRLLHLVCLAVSLVPLSAASIFRVDFEGIVTGGGVSSATMTSQSLTPFDLTGSKLRGSMTFDLSIAPVPVDTTGSIGATTQQRDYRSAGGPAWVRTVVEIDMPLLPSDFLFVPKQFAVSPFPTDPAFARTGGSESNQSLSMIVADPCCDSFVSIVDFRDSGTFADGRIFTRNSFFGLILSAGGSFLPTDAPLPAPFRVGLNNSTSRLGYLGFERDSTGSDAPLFGLTSSYLLNVDFQVTSASGDFVVPEPSTLVLCGFGLAVAALARRFGRRIAG